MSLGAVGRRAADALGLTAAATDLVLPPTGAPSWPSSLPIAALAVDSVALASLALNLALAARSGRDAAPVQVERVRVAASFGSDRLLRINGQAPSVWSPLSGFWMVEDGWVRTHANYPHHERALRSLLGATADAGTAEVSAALLSWTAIELEDRAAQCGAVVGAARTPQAWAQHPQGLTVRTSPLIERRRTEGARPREWGPGDAPLAGVRILDLTRVLAGPVASRDLAFAGADVLRVDPPALAEAGWTYLDTGQDKRSTLLDLGDSRDRATFDALLSRADVVLTGYRPEALSRFGIDADTLAQRHPGLVTASVSAWGSRGPWALRRGFDSIVQAVSGISIAESADGVTPGVLPVQALDHATGHLLAAAIVLALIEQRRWGGSPDVRISIAGTGQALLESTDSVLTVADMPVLPVVKRDLTEPRPISLTYAPPTLAFSGAASDYGRVGGTWGSDPAEWIT
ncbi:CoA transferase [Microbacterium sp. NPDC055357]